MQETIKGLDRRTREWNDEVTEKDKHISELQEMYNELKGDNLKLQAKVTELDVRLASWLADVAMQTK
jgi:chromosome segregation ATPase